MTDILQAIVLGIVEGITEFLPISSTGHLILVNQWFSFQEPFTFLFDIVIQLGAILAVVVYFFRRLLNIQIWKKALLGVIPAIVLGFLFADVIEQQFFNPVTVAITLLFGGFLLIYIERKEALPKFNTVAEIPLRIIVCIGLIQSISMIPGVSRAGATIVGAMLLGTSRIAAVEFSFFLAIPTMVAASGYSLLKYGGVMTAGQLGVLTIGFIVSFIVALLVIKFFITYIQKHNLAVFGWYRIALGGLILALILGGF